jgi:dihydroorotate dehydrogenase
MMIRLSNGHSFQYVIASGALGFDGRGWFWEKPLVWLGLIQLKLFTIILRTLTRHPRPYPISNFSWIRPWTWLPFSPWSCVRLILGGAVNKIGLWNPGIDYWCEKIAPKMDFEKYAFIASIFGTEEELEYMAEKLNAYDLKGVEVNPSCPNIAGHTMDDTETVIKCGKAVKRKTRHSVIMKLSCDQDCPAIARGLTGVTEAISLNSVPWKTAFPNGEQTPLWRLENKVGGGGGGVSGKPAQKYNWAAVEALANQGLIPVIGPSVMEFEDLVRVRELGAKAVSFGAIHLPSHPFWLKPWTLFTNPCKPTSFVQKE